MSVLNYNEIKERKYIVLDGDPYEVLDSHVFRKQQRKPVNQTKLRNLITGSVRQETFHSADTVSEADLQHGEATFIFKKENKKDDSVEYWFCEGNDRSKRFELDSSIVGDKMKFIKENKTIETLIFNEQIIGIQIPIKVELKVIEAAPAVKGNTATGATKTVTLETGLEVNVPLFIEEGEVLSINTDKCEYVERVKG
ncbi:elongation factor P [Candidatus Nomurabacteria bacterium]|nr:elongation factor P [Candidatus Nomurabacteria bacterium]